MGREVTTTNQHLHDASNALFATVADRIGAVAAAGAIASPFWLTRLQGVSEVAAILAPILGVVWLLVQIITKVIEGWRSARK